MAPTGALQGEPLTGTRPLPGTRQHKADHRGYASSKWASSTAQKPQSGKMGGPEGPPAATAAETPADVMRKLSWEMVEAKRRHPDSHGERAWKKLGGHSLHVKVNITLNNQWSSLR
ncbi:hypothetical protein AGOR_G00243960 [Albula goreensis]|uniref:Uncharacterized protein n=1 Tax=Albula goreensis TaxID=1534307 RepID=A0A8T3CL56_9TELE|nr:hypothetical protein AGOR_G00243960 [Albula goreensis]